MNRYLTSSLFICLVGSAFVGAIACGDEDPATGNAAGGSAGAAGASTKPIGTAGSSSVSPQGGAGGTGGSGTTGAKTIFDTADTNNELATLVAAVSSADASIAALLKDTTKTLTVFAPKNAAFEALPGGAACVTALTNSANKAVLTSLLQYHVLTTKVPSSALQPTQDVETALTGKKVKIVVTGTGMNKEVKVNTSKVVTPDVDTSNGVVHVIDKVLIPEGIVLPSACK